MLDDPILDEIHRLRDAHAARFGYDIDAIVRDLQDQERKENRPLAAFPPRPPVVVATRPDPEASPDE